MRHPFTNWDPWRDLNQLQTEVNRLFAGVGRPQSRRTAYPAMNVYHSADGLLLTAEVPGLDPDSLDINVTGKAVTIRGRHPGRELQQGESYLRQERPSAEFARSIELPFEVDPQRAEAEYNNGVLTLKLHRPEEHKPRKVAIKRG